MTHLKVGDKAPDFTLPSHLDKQVTLSDLQGTKNVVLAFFPLAWTPV
jgi:peroxiredoxin